ncbi:MAG: hypothetical protein HC810_08440 [Acaryochloridaceae cyanobacterium RL_2_7]|nr:hypothetical protein [Acaryochloridaceae cyanobacterium RL_2_7]
MNERIDSILGLAGLNKSPMPPSPSQALLKYREAQSDQTVAPYLGHWIVRDTFLPFYDAHIFPSPVKGQICILSQQYHHFDGYSIPMGEIVPPNPSLSFSVVNLSSNPSAALGLTTHSDLLMKRENPLSQAPIEFLSLMDDAQKQVIYAAKDQPTKPKFLSSAVHKQWKAYGCQN